MDALSPALVTLAHANRNAVSTMRDAVLFDGDDRSRRLKRFWLLLSLASVIAAAGVVADSTATVIGAMIVAPMLLPIQGTMLSTVLGDRTNLVRSVTLVIAGAAVAIAIGYLVGLMVPNDVIAVTNSQVSSRVSPSLIDLLAALGTGVVGAIALVRKDISDTMPGVAIAISLVPPLNVVGLTLESHAYAEALGALLLFATNVAAILVTGIVVMALYGVHRIPVVAAQPGGATMNRGNAVVAMVVMFIVVGVPLTFSSITSAADAVRESSVTAAADEWANDAGWDLLDVATEVDKLVVRVTGPLPLPDPDRLEKLLIERRLDPSTIEVEMVPSYVVELGRTP